MKLSAAHASTLRWIALGSAFFVAVAATAYMAWPETAGPEGTHARLTACVRLLRFPAAIVLAMIMSCFRILYDEGTLDPLAGKETSRHRVNQRVLQNTVEHMIVFVPALCAMGVAAATPATWRFVPMAVTLFCAGRVLFWIGYHVSANARGFGFNLSFSTTLATTVLAFVFNA